MASKFGGNSFLWRAGNYTPVISAVLCLLVAIFMQSRAFTMGYATAILFLFFAYQQFILKPAYIAGGIIGLALLTIALIFLFKTDSSAGRVLIYKVSWT